MCERERRGAHLLPVLHREQKYWLAFMCWINSLSPAVSSFFSSVFVCQSSCLHFQVLVLFALFIPLSLSLSLSIFPCWASEYYFKYEFRSQSASSPPLTLIIYNVKLQMNWYEIHLSPIRFVLKATHVQTTSYWMIKYSNPVIKSTDRLCHIHCSSLLFAFWLHLELTSGNKS